MVLKNLQILIVTDDGRLAADLTEPIMTGLDASITLADSLEEAAVLASSGGFDVILAARRLSDGPGLSLLDHFDAEHASPVILVGESVDAEEALAEIRRGAADLLCTPIDPALLRDVIRRAAETRRTHARREARSRRLRHLSSRLLRDRRELRQRVDLICQDLVVAYRRLVDKVARAGVTGGALSRCDPTHGRG